MLRSNLRSSVPTSSQKEQALHGMSFSWRNKQECSPYSCMLEPCFALSDTALITKIMAAYTSGSFLLSSVSLLESSPIPSKRKQPTWWPDSKNSFLQLLFASAMVPGKKFLPSSLSRATWSRSREVTTSPQTSSWSWPTRWKSTTRVWPESPKIFFVSSNQS